MKLSNNVFGKQYYHKLSGGFAIGMENHVYSVKEFKSEGVKLQFAHLIDGIVKPESEKFTIHGMLIYKSDPVLKEIVLSNPDTAKTLNCLLTKEVADWTNRLLKDFPNIVLCKVRLGLVK